MNSRVDSTFLIVYLTYNGMNNLVKHINSYLKFCKIKKFSYDFYQLFPSKKITNVEAECKN